MAKKTPTRATRPGDPVNSRDPNVLQRERERIERIQQRLESERKKIRASGRTLLDTLSKDVL